MVPGLGGEASSYFVRGMGRRAAKGHSVVLKTRKPPPCGVPTAFPTGKHPEGPRDWVHGFLSAPHSQGKSRVGAPPPRQGGMVGIEPHSCREGEKKSKAAFHRKQHFLFVQLSMCAPSGQCPVSQSQGRAQCLHGQRSAGGEWGTFAP